MVGGKDVRDSVVVDGVGCRGVLQVMNIQASFVTTAPNMLINPDCLNASLSFSPSILIPLFFYLSHYTLLASVFLILSLVFHSITRC